MITKGSAERATDGAYGVLYIAPACLALVWLIGLATGAPAGYPDAVRRDLGGGCLRLPGRQRAQGPQAVAEIFALTKHGQGSSADFSGP